MDGSRVPTINDLRVKLCYICREEERHDSPPEQPPREWKHPCTCTLVAHEQCLLKWIQISQGTASRAPNALKCPQCGTKYELESNKPIILHILSAGNKVLQHLGQYFALIGTASVIGVVGTSVYLCLTAYGAWAVDKFIGTDMYNTILTNDPSNWPWSAYISLPLIPISLISSRFQVSSLSIPLLLWSPASAGPVGEKGRRLLEHWSKPENAARLSQMKSIPVHGWPPPPLILGIIGFPVIRAFYQKFYTYLYYKCTGTHLPPPPPRRERGFFNGGLFMIHIRAGAGRQEVNPNGEVQQRLEQQLQEQQQQQQVPAAAVDENPDPNAVAAEAAEQHIEVNSASLGRRIGGALIIPYVSSFMGDLLFRLSKHSGILRSFLGIRPKKVSWMDYMLPPWMGLQSRLGAFPEDIGWENLDPYQKVKRGFQVFINAFFTSGTWTLAESDPVWWRNAVGIGIFVVMKDCVQLLHLWLAKRELESRRVKDRDFKGVDIRELDLLPSFYH